MTAESSGTGWQAHVEQLCYGGEGLLESVRGRSAGVAVTSHRVLAFTPESAGANLRTVERPNATGLSKGATGDERWFLAGGKWLIVGVALAVAGFGLDFGGLMGTLDQTPGQIGVSWIGGLFSLFRTGFSLLDDVLLLGGGAAVLGGLALLGWYWQTRREIVAIHVAGGPDLELPGAGFSEEGVTRLQRAIEPPVTDDSNPTSD
ncbi:MAG: hypothetical protein ABEJ60_05220 [Halodesulfurarchaeum sp.]